MISAQAIMMRLLFSTYLGVQKQYNHSSMLCIDGLVQACSDSSALAMELLQASTKPSIWARILKLERVGYHVINLSFYQMEDIQLTECTLPCTKVEGSFVVEGQSVYAELQPVCFDSHLAPCSPEELIRRRYHCSSECETIGLDFGHPNLHPRGHHYTGQNSEIHQVGSQQTPHVLSPPTQTSLHCWNYLDDDNPYPTSFLTPPTIPSPPMDSEDTPRLWQTDNGFRYEDITSDSGPESPDRIHPTRNLFIGSRVTKKKGQKRRHSASGGHQRDANSKRRQRTCFSQEQVG